MKQATKKKIAKYWGYLLLPVLYFGWFVFHVGPIVLGVVSVLVVVYFLFQAPVPCCAETRDRTTCRNNAKGILGGCHIESHKWQNVKLLIRRRLWGRLASGLFRQVKGNAAAISALAGSTSAIAAGVTLLMKV
ncbi:MAG TPA: hypothetical protein VHX38_17350 [Pseudonocardiaceae bacterium]|nr:hypothetical protein [Pseudonocardiaceae bacterium]